MWSNTDLAVLSFIIFIIFIFIGDIYLRATKPISKATNISRETIMLILSMTTSSIFIYLNTTFHHIDNFFAIVNYYNLEHAIIRGYVIKYLLIIYTTGLVIAPILSVYFAYRLNTSKVKWFIYSFIMNWLGLFYLLSITTKKMRK